MEELLKINKKQLLVQRIIAGCLIFIVVMMLAAGVMFTSQMKQMSAALDEAMAIVEQIDVEAINDSITQTQEMMQSVNEFSAAVDGVTEKVQELDTWVSGFLGN